MVLFNFLDHNRWSQKYIGFRFPSSRIEYIFKDYEFIETTKNGVEGYDAIAIAYKKNNPQQIIKFDLIELLNYFNHLNNPHKYMLGEELIMISEIDNHN